MFRFGQFAGEHSIIPATRREQDLPVIPPSSVLDTTYLPTMQGYQKKKKKKKSKEMKLGILQKEKNF